MKAHAREIGVRGHPGPLVPLLADLELNLECATAIAVTVLAMLRKTEPCNAGPCGNTGGNFQRMGFGYCLTPNGSGVEGMIRFDLTGDECRQACESRNDCIGYAGQISRKHTCYIYGPYRGSKPSGWSGVSGTGSEIGRGSENFQTMNCYKRV